MDLPAGERGIIGLPSILALQPLRWSKNGEIEIGFPSPSSDSSHANLYFDGEHPIARVGFESGRLDMILDTGAEESQIWNRFAMDPSKSANKARRKDYGYRHTDRRKQGL